MLMFVIHTSKSQEKTYLFQQVLKKYLAVSPQDVFMRRLLGLYPCSFRRKEKYPESRLSPSYENYYAELLQLIKACE